MFDNRRSIRLRAARSPDGGFQSIERLDFCRGKTGKMVPKDAKSRRLFELDEQQNITCTKGSDEPLSGRPGQRKHGKIADKKSPGRFSGKQELGFGPATRSGRRLLTPVFFSDELRGLSIRSRETENRILMRSQPIISPCCPYEAAHLGEFFPGDGLHDSPSSKTGTKPGTVCRQLNHHKFSARERRRNCRRPPRR